MPVDFLTAEHEQGYGRFAGEVSAADLAHYFHFDDADRAFIAERRGEHNRLGLGVQLGTVRYLGTFLDDPAAVPASVVAAVATQLGIADLEGLERYRTGETRWDHTLAIRHRYGYREFVEQPGHLRFVRWLNARAWTSAEQPTVLFDQAVAHLIARKVLLPGVSVLERLVAQVRDRPPLASGACWPPRTLGRPGPTTLEQEQAAYEAAVRDEHLVAFTVYDAATAQPIGLAYLGEIDDRHRTADFGLVIGEAAFRGRGYGTEATRLVLDYAFTVRGLHNVGLSVYAYNHAGQRAYARAGFREVGRRRQARRLGSQPWDVIYMDCLATEFVSPLLDGIFLSQQRIS
jgi:RimJ/RimL family protein N-acetyltransferase